MSETRKYTYVVGLPNGRLEIHALGQAAYLGRCPACVDSESRLDVGDNWTVECNRCGRLWWGQRRGNEFVATWQGPGVNAADVTVLLA
jgi:hypothetical protein